MIAIPFTCLFPTNIEMIDAQHKKLVSYINILCSAMDEGIEIETTREVFNRLVRNITDHISNEETHMLIHGYSGYEPNSNLHQQLMHKLDACNVYTENGDLAISNELINFFKEWLLNHLNHHEKIISHFLAEKIA